MSGARIVALILLVEAASVWAQSVVTDLPMTNVGGLKVFVAEVCAIGIALALIVWATSEVALVLDTRRNSRTPRAASALLGVAVVGSAAFVSISASFFLLPEPIDNEPLFAVAFAVLAIVWPYVTVVWPYIKTLMPASSS